MKSYGIRIIGTGNWRLTVNHAGEVWNFDTQQVAGDLSGLFLPPPGYQGMWGATCYRSLDGTTLLWLGGWGWIGFATGTTILDVQATLLSEKGEITITSAVDTTTTASSDPRLLLALTPLGLQSLGREASQPEETMKIDLPPEVVESLRALSQQLAG
jgi:hypothetical protein